LPDVAAALARRLADIVGSCANAASLNSSEYLPSDYLPPRVYLMKLACGEHYDKDCAARIQNIQTSWHRTRAIEQL
jgi:hypothetical protein